jgi:F0F1-type ATP synthase epsilon subunit
VSILCERAEMSHESDYEEARRKLEEAKAKEDAERR